MNIFGGLGSLFGYVLWFIYTIVKNYGIAILIFAIFIKIILFPFSVKQQKSTAGMAALGKKDAELRKKYANNRKKLEEERAKLYQEEGVNPFGGSGGCLTMVIPLLLMMCIYWAVVSPLSNTLHIDNNQIDHISTVMNQIPGIGASSATNYRELEMVKYFDVLKPYLGDSVTPDTVSMINEFRTGFNFCGLDLLGYPSDAGVSPLLIIPALCLITQIGTQIYMQKRNSNGMNQQQGCMKYIIYFFPLITTYFAYIVPAGVGFYWIASTVTGFLQTVILYKYFGPAVIKAKSEAARVLLNEQKELKVKKL